MSPHSENSPAVLEPLPGYVRMTIATFDSLTFPQRMAFEDEDLRLELAQEEPRVLQAGFCDWVDATAQTRVCIGWAWCLQFGDPCERLAPGGFSSNVLLLGDDGSALGQDHTDQVLRDWLASQAWQGSLVKDGGYHHLRDLRH
ncbi:MAG: DUF4902 domain-containing protein [Xanthomonadales bacterium]|nr:DUF4902 domain-containing protein [Xanthomonadales bacterium]